MLTDNGYPLRIIKQMIWQRKRHHHQNMEQEYYLPTANNSNTASQRDTHNFNSPS